jgi:uncharacterized membrane protein
MTFSGTTYKRIWMALAVALSIAVFASPSHLLGDEKKDGGPERGIKIYTEYSGISVPTGETVMMDLIVDNTGKKDESVDVSLGEAPKDWKGYLRSGAFTVTGVFVPAGKSRKLSITLEQGKSMETGTYPFRFNARSRDGEFTATYTLNVTVQPKAATGADFTVSTSYPVLSGKTDSKFEFTFEIANRSVADRSFNLAALAKDKWEVTFRPGYESKNISSLMIKAGQSQSISVEVTPFVQDKPGEYPLVVRVGSGDKSADVKFTVILQGIYSLESGTTTGVLSLDAIAGKPSKFSIFVRNTGSATFKDVVLSAYKPENWDATVKPDKLEGLEPGATVQAEVTVTPGPRALVGDYSVGVNVNAYKADKTIEMRVTVKASTAWGWIGIGIVLLVIAGLAVLFVVLGRR